MNNNLVEKGTKYDKIPDCYVIFICQNDYFERGEAMYKIRRMEVESKEIVDDGQELIVVNGEYKDESSAIGRLMHDFRCVDPDEMYSEVLKKWMKYYKQEEGGLHKMYEISEKWMKQGYEEGLSDGISQGFTNGKMDILISQLKRN